jgi:hypothetical protein
VTSLPEAIDNMAAIRLGARVAACDVMNYVNDIITVAGILDGNELRRFLFDYWMNAGGFDDDDEGPADGQG